MSNRTTPLLLLIIIGLALYWFWKQPETHDDMAKLKAGVEALPDKAITAAAKVSNRIEDQKIPEKTENALDNLKEDVKETKENIKEDFEEAKRKDREQQ